MNRIFAREERIRNAIVWDLIRYDLLTCKPISTQRDTAHITRMLPDEPTEPDKSRTVTMSTKPATAQ